MKNPLYYQLSEYDCGATSVLNALTYLFERQEIPPDFLKCIIQCCMDSYNEKGEPYRCGTSPDAMRYLAAWMNRYAQTMKFPLYCEHLRGSEVHLDKGSPIYNCLQQGGAVVARCHLCVPHYITLTGINETQVHVFDAYYDDHPPIRPGVVYITDCPKQKNRSILWHVMENEGTNDYSLGATQDRDITLFYRTQSR